MNSLYATTKQGTIGELIVQLRLLEHDVQAAPPLKDSGNDLIAVYKDQFRAIQVRTTTVGKIDKPSSEIAYHVLAIVELARINGRLSTQTAKIYLFTADEAPFLSSSLTKYQNRLFSAELVAHLFH